MRGLSELLILNSRSVVGSSYGRYALDPGCQYVIDAHVESLRSIRLFELFTQCGFLQQFKTGTRGCLSMDVAQKFRMLRILMLRNIMV